jgi:hypothetical protein
MSVSAGGGLGTLREAWLGRWPAALAIWSRFTRLSEPRWCLSEQDERREGLSGSFAMIRFEDHAVVISLRQVQALHLEPYALEIMAHEIGHHVYCPADLTDHARVIARVRRGLPTREALAGMVANLYTDLLINDRLQRSAELRMADVYRALGGGATDGLWTLYLRIYEILWSLGRGTLAAGEITPKMEGDAQLGARLVRVYAKDWVRGAGRFAVLCLPYLLEQTEGDLQARLGPLHDTGGAGRGGGPDGLGELDDDEEEAPPHPAEDPEVTGFDEEGDGDAAGRERERARPPAGGREERGDTATRRRYREPAEYREVLRAAGVTLDDEEVAMRYYRELAVPHLVPFPVRLLPETSEPLPEGLETWEAGFPLEDVDWVESVVRSPSVIPGLTTVQRTYGSSAGSEPERRPVDLYLGIDCSGSMANPRLQLSYPVLAGAIMALSALRGGARVMAVLSGHPGSHASTGEFVADERAVFKVLTGYLGTGYAFGIPHLAEIPAPVDRRVRPAHLIVITDHDIFAMLEEGGKGGKDRRGWEIARAAAAAAGGGATYLLHMQPGWEKGKVQRMERDGWRVHCIRDWADVVAFAREFSRARYGEERLAPQGGRRR